MVCSLSADGVMRTMTPDKLLKAMPALQTQVDTLLEFDVSIILDFSLIKSNIGIIYIIYVNVPF